MPCGSTSRMPFSTAGMKFRGITPPTTPSSKLEALTAAERPELEPRVAVLSAASRLALVLALRLGRALDRLLVGHLRRLQLHLGAELALQALDHHFQVELAGARDDELLRLLVAVDAERRVLLHEAVEALHDLLVVGLALRRNGEGDRRGRVGQRREDDRRLLVTERVARGHVFQLRDRHDVARDGRRHLRLLLTLELQRVADALAHVARVVDAVSVGTART